MKTILCCLLLFIPGLTYGNWPPPGVLYDDLDRKIDSTFGPTSYIADRSWFTPDMKPLVYERLFKRLEYQKEIGYEQGAVYVMGSFISAGHIPTIEKQVALTYELADGCGFFRYSREETFPYLMEGVMTATKRMPPRSPKNELLYVSARQVFAFEALHAIENLKVFPPETEKWADGMRYGGEKEEYYDLIKEWWVHNKEAVLDKRYADATWLPRYKGRPKNIYTRYDVDREEKELQQRAERRAAVKKSAVASAKGSEERGSLYTWLAAGTFVIVAISYGLLQNRRKNQTE